MPSNNPNAVSQLKPFTGKNDPRNGRKPKGSKHLTTWIQELLEDDDFEADLLDSKQGLINFKGAPIKAIVSVVRHKAVNGDLKAVDLLMKYGWSQKIEQDITSNGETVAQPDASIAASFAAFLKEQTKSGY
jgi:hypothetical protein